ncbi:MAG: GNAT family N-acetyltransferase [Coxiellaceae bacterium]|nr:MAG: GNAT family N-acetyltransferase [Coxiellaceae bacterium]
MKTLEIVTLQGQAVVPYIKDLAELRCKVFREFPYLYIGNSEYERKYLATYLECPSSTLILVFDNKRVVGASTAIPLKYEVEECKQPFIKNGYDIDQVFYFGESVLLHEYRGQGIGKEFFKRREQAARQQNYQLATFCAVERPQDHPRRPADYKPLDEFWRMMGFVKHPEIATTYYWQDLDETTESLKPMTFWLKWL